MFDRHHPAPGRVRRLAAWLAPAVLSCLLAGQALADDASDVLGLVKAKRYPEALTRVEAALASKPRDAQLRFLKGVILAESNRPAEAIIIFSRFTEDYPHLPEPWNNLAVLYAAQGQVDKARATLEKALRTNPAYATAYENLGDIHAKLAGLAYERALQIDSGGNGARTKLALVSNLGQANNIPPRSIDLGPAPRPQSLPQPVQIPPLAQAPGVTPQPAARPAQPATPPPVAAQPSVTPPAPAPQPPVPQQKPSAPQPAAPQAAAPQQKPSLPQQAATQQPAAAQQKPSLPQQAATQQSPAPAPAVKQPATPQAQPAPAPTQQAAHQGKPGTAAPVPPMAAAPAPKPEADKARAAKAEAVERDAVLAAVSAWARDWSERDVKGYLSHYASDFETPGKQSRKAWAEERQARIAGKGRIQVKVEAPQVSLENGRAIVKFRQQYSSDRLSVSSRKTLTMVRQKGRWLIQKESTGS